MWGGSHGAVDLGPSPRGTAPAVAPAPRDTPEARINPRLLRQLQPIRAEIPKDAAGEARVALGKQVFFDPTLSRDGDLTCNS